MLGGFSGTFNALFGSSSSSTSTPIVWTHGDLLTAEFPPQVWVIEGLVPASGLTVLAGKKKLGKSWMALQAAQAVAAGSLFLGRKTEQGTVLYLALEDGPRRLHLRMKRQQAPSDLPIKYVPSLKPLDRGGMADLSRLIEEHSPRLVIIDTLAAAKSGKVGENDAGDMGDLFNPLRQLAQRHDVAILVVAHHGKSQRGDPGDDIRGSSAVGAASDMNIGLYREDGRTWLKVEGRDVEEGEINLAFNAQGTCTWSVASDARQSARTASEAEVIQALIHLGEADAEAVAVSLGKDRSTVQTTLKRMRDEGRLSHRTDAQTGRIVYFLLVRE